MHTAAPVATCSSISSTLSFLGPHTGADPSGRGFTAHQSTHSAGATRVHPIGSSRRSAMPTDSRSASGWVAATATHLGSVATTSLHSPIRSAGSHTKATSTCPSRSACVSPAHSNRFGSTVASGWQVVRAVRARRASGPPPATTNPTRSTLRSAAAVVRTSLVVSCHSARWRRAAVSNCSPAGVSRTSGRVNRSAPSRSSSCRICRDSDGCATNSSFAACVKLSRSATVTK